MTRNNRTRLRFLRAPEGEGDAAGGGGAAPPGDAGGQGDEGSLLDGVQPGGQGEPPADKPFAERVPEKYRVLGTDGQLDLAATAEKIEAARASLESKLGKGASVQVPATPDDYKIEAPKDAEGKPLEGFDVEGFTGDPLFKEFAKDAHAKGMTNEQLQFVVDKYLAVAPQLIAADQQLSLEEARSELATIWPDQAAMQRNLAVSLKAIRGFGGEADDAPGSRARLENKFGRDPDFIAFAAKVGSEMQEDRVPGGASVASEVDVEALLKSEAYWTPAHPDHKSTVAKVQEHYARKFGTKARGRG